MKNFVKLVGVFLIALFILLNHCMAIAQSLAVAPDFQLTDLKKNTVVLSSYRNKQPVLLFFWTTWCPYCREQLMGIEQSIKSGELTNNIEMIAINIGESADKVEKFVKLRNLTFRFLLDSDEKVAQSFNIIGVPTYVLINKEGKVISADNSFPTDKIKNASSQ